MYIYIHYHIFTHVIHNARVNDNVIALTGINKVLLYCIVLYLYELRLSR